MLQGLLAKFLKYLWPSNLLSGFSFVLAEWHRGNARDRSLLLLIFTPMMICMAGLLFSFASFVFAFISRLLGWFLLTALFGGGGIFFYEKLKEKRSNSEPRQTTSQAYDVTAENTTTTGAKTGSGPTPEQDKQKRWFQDLYNKK